MVNRPRSRIPNVPYFLTATLHDRGSRLLLDHIDELRAAFRCAAFEHPFHIDAVVILPDHLARTKSGKRYVKPPPPPASPRP
jgi:putative transposase